MISHMLDALAFVVGCTVINRMRGNRDWKPSWLPGRPLFYCTALMFALMLMPMGLYGGLAVAAAYFFWGVWPWGRWYDIDELEENYTGPPSALERAIEAVSFGQDSVALFIRHLFITPGLFLIAYFTGQPWPFVLLCAGTFAICAVSAYSAGKDLQPDAPTVVAEYIVGAMWGLVLLALWGTMT